MHVRTTLAVVIMTTFSLSSGVGADPHPTGFCDHNAGAEVCATKHAISDGLLNPWTTAFHSDFNDLGGWQSYDIPYVRFCCNGPVDRFIENDADTEDGASLRVHIGRSHDMAANTYRSIELPYEVDQVEIEVRIKVPHETSSACNQHFRAVGVFSHAPLSEVEELGEFGADDPQLRDADAFWSWERNLGNAPEYRTFTERATLDERTSDLSLVIRTLDTSNICTIDVWYDYVTVRIPSMTSQVLSTLPSHEPSMPMVLQEMIDIAFINHDSRHLEAEYETFFGEFGGRVTFMTDWPTDSAPYDIIVLSGYGAASRMNVQTAIDYVESGGRLSLQGGVPYFHCGYNLACYGWFGPSARYANLGTGATASIAESHPFGTGLQSGHQIITGTCGPGAAGIRYASGATEALSWNSPDISAMLYHETDEGGRVHYTNGWSIVARGDGCEEVDLDANRELLAGATLWLAEGKTDTCVVVPLGEISPLCFD